MQPLSTFPLHSGLGGGSQVYQKAYHTIGPSGVRALPLAAVINVGGHYKCHFGPSVLRAPAEQTKVATVLGN